MFTQKIRIRFDIIGFLTAYVYQSVFYKNGAYTMFKGEEPSVWYVYLPLFFGIRKIL